MRIDERFDDRNNFRDLKGLKTGDGREVKEGFFYRGAGLGYFSKEELEEFKKLNIHTIMDLRSRQEIERLPDPVIPGTRTIEHSGLVVEGSEDIDWSPQGMKKIGGEAKEQLSKIEEYYKKIAIGNKAFQIMMEEVVNNHLPIYFHCATGKDRTGVAAMILLMALDIKEEEIRKDYLLSNVFRKEILEQTFEENREQIKDHPELKKLLQIQDGVLESTFETVMHSILDRYGSKDRYLEEEFGLTKEKKEELKKMCLAEPEGLSVKENSKTELFGSAEGSFSIPEDFDDIDISSDFEGEIFPK